MPKEPNLIVIQWTDIKVATKGKCSLCDTTFDSSAMPPDKQEWALRDSFAYHVKENHSGENVNQTAVRTVREATHD